MANFPAFIDATGHLSFADRKALDRHLRTLKGCDVVFSVKRKTKRRSYDQLRYWFGVPMKILSEHTGYTKMQMHYLCLAVCFGVLTDPVTGFDVPVVPASRHLTAQQFSELIEWVGPWAFDAYDGLEIPLPEHVDLSELPGVDDDTEAA